MSEPQWRDISTDADVLYLVWKFCAEGEEFRERVIREMNGKYLPTLDSDGAANLVRFLEIMEEHHAPNEVKVAAFFFLQSAESKAWANEHQRKQSGIY